MTLNKRTRNFAWLLCLLLASIVSLRCSKNNDNDPAKRKQDLPYSEFMLLGYSSYVEVPHHANLNPTEAITLEGWVRYDHAVSNTPLMGKNWMEGYSVVGYAEPEGFLLHSYLWGNQQRKSGGEIPILQWFHWAVTSDGSVRRHYINGEMVAEFPEVEKMGSSADPLRFAYPGLTNTGLAEFRLWDVARTPEEIKSSMNKDITMAMPGLIAVWPLEKDAKDIIGGHDGIMHNNPQFKIWEE